MKINKECKHCNCKFLADSREVNRGNAKFCSLTCAAAYNNSNRNNSKYELICKHCSISFKSISNNSKYCSNLCKQKNYRLKKKSGNIYDYKLEKIIQQYPCEICSWKEASRDSHHITPVSKGGKSTIDNLISLCPNHHRMAHYNLFSQDYLLKIVKSRTISSSLESLLNLIKSKEQDANLVIKEA